MTDTLPTATPATGTGDVADGAPAPTPVTLPEVVVPRSAPGTVTIGSIAITTVHVFFQAYPGTRHIDGTPIGIANEPWTLVYDSGLIWGGTTAADGLAEVFMPAGTSATLHIMGTQYRITPLTTLEPVTDRAGVQRRLGMIGYNLGSAGISGTNNADTERAIVEFQCDADLDIDALTGPQTRGALTSADWAGE